MARSPNLKPTLEGSCRVLSEVSCSPLSTFAEYHQTVSIDVGEIEMRDTKDSRSMARSDLFWILGTTSVHLKMRESPVFRP